MQNSMLAYHCLGTTYFSNNGCLSLLTTFEPLHLAFNSFGHTQDALITDQFFQIATIISALKFKILTGDMLDSMRFFN